jgi:YbbR domain-containing protein
MPLSARPAAIENRWFLRLAAFLVASLLWLFVSLLPRLEDESEPRAELAIDATVAYQNPRPDDLMILNRGHQISVLVRGRESLVQGLDTREVDIRIPFPRQFTANEPIDVQLAPDLVTLPEGLEAVSVTPNVITLLIDEKESVKLPVRVVFTGEPAAGLTRLDVQSVVEPGEVTVQGPKHQLESLTEVTTAPVNLDGRAVRFSERVEVRVGGQATRILTPSLVKVTVFFGPVDDLTVAGTGGR